MRARLNDLATGAAMRAGVVDLLVRSGVRRSGRGFVLMYHGVTDTWADRAVEKLHQPLAGFRAQIRDLERNLHFISAAQLGAALRGEHALDPGWVLLTFDDGYRNNVTHVADALWPRPWVCYLTTGLVGTTGRLPGYRVRSAIRGARAAALDLPTLGRRLALDDRRAAVQLVSNALKQLPAPAHDALLGEIEAGLEPGERAELDARHANDALMSWDDARALHAAGVTLGGHTEHHHVLHPGQPAAVARAEVSGCAARLEAEIGAVPETFAWPNGGVLDLSAVALAALEESPFQWSITTLPGSASTADPAHLLPRLGAGTEAALARNLVRGLWTRGGHRRTLETMWGTLAG